MKLGQLDLLLHEVFQLKGGKTEPPHTQFQGHTPGGWCPPHPAHTHLYLCFPPLLMSHWSNQVMWPSLASKLQGITQGHGHSRCDSLVKQSAFPFQMRETGMSRRRKSRLSRMGRTRWPKLCSLCMWSVASVMSDCAMLWTVAHQTPLSMGFSRQESQQKNTGVDCHALLQGNFLLQGSNPCPLCLLHWQVGSLPCSATWEGLCATGVKSLLTLDLSFLLCEMEERLLHLKKLVIREYKGSSP